MYARKFDGVDYDFGVAGVNEGTLIMYDAQTQSRWSQLQGEATEGAMKGKTLEKLPSTMTTWGQWRELHPETTVYVKRSVEYSPDFTGESFRRIAEGGEGPIEPQDLVVGLEGHVEARAYLVRRLAGDRLVEDEMEGAPILVYLSDDLATAKVYGRTLGERTLTFRLAGDVLTDVETGSGWNALTGEALSGPLKGKRLQPMISTYALWFAWKKYRPDTVVHGEPVPMVEAKEKPEPEAGPGS